MAEVLFGIDFGACNLKCVKLGEKKISGVRLTANEMTTALITCPTPFSTTRIKTAKSKK